MNAPLSGALFLLVAAAAAAGAAAQPQIAGADVTLLGVLPSGYKPCSMDIGEVEDGPYRGRWLYFGSDNNVSTGQVLIRMSVGATNDPDLVGSVAGFQHSYCTAVYDPDGVFVDRNGLITGVPGRILVASSNPSDNAGVLWRIDASADEAGGGFSFPHPYANPSVAINNCDFMTQDDSDAFYLNVPGQNEIAQMIGVPENNGGTFQTFAVLPSAAGAVVYDGSNRIWSSGKDGIVRRMETNREGTPPLPRREVDMVWVDLLNGEENGLTASRALPGAGGAWGGGVLAVRRGTGNGELVRIRSNTLAVDLLGTQLGDVLAMKVDADGILYAADYSTGEVWRVERSERLGCGPGDVGGTGGETQSDGQLSNDDFIVFIDYFFGEDPRADRGSAGGVRLPDGAWNNNDFVVFVDDFFSGC
ncbi:MAG TPA: GC-type dockerin domain-anchored protein [Phycisphaerales bacterium]|nr:GC-type dockerin domain-anchored protein [Phycisphaerales bacterium]